MISQLPQIVLAHGICTPLPSSQLLPLQTPLNLTDAPLPHQPKRSIIPARPRKILHRIIRLYPHQQRPRLVQHIYPLPRGRHHIPVPRHLEPVRHPPLREIQGAFVRDVRAVAGDVEGVNGAFTRGVEGGALGSEGGGNGAGDGARVGDVDGAFIGGDGNAVGLGEGVFDDVDGAGGGAETVRGGFELRGCVGEFVEPGIFCKRVFQEGYFLWVWRRWLVAYEGR